MCRGKDVNRRWLNQIFKDSSSTDSIFAGTTTREVALSIVGNLDMHASYVGKVDDLLTKLIKQGHYKLFNGQLVAWKAEPVHIINHRAARRRRIARRRRAPKLYSQRRRDHANFWQSEAMAAA